MVLMMFQSAPLTDVRGDGSLENADHQKPEVSIRSPHGCKGRYLRKNPAMGPKTFQSAPLTDVRGDKTRLQGACFNL